MHEVVFFEWSFTGIKLLSQDPAQSISMQGIDSVWTQI